MNDSNEPVSAPLRRLGASLLTLGRVRLELLAIEVQEEKERVAGLLLWALSAALLAGFCLLTAMVFVIVALWDTHRLLALGGATLLLFAAAVFAFTKVRALLAMPATLFQTSLAELREDADALRREPPP